jgi:hypothetical protein
MKKAVVVFAAPVAVALILGLAVYAVPATGSSSSLATRVSRLETAQKRLAAANAKLAAANTKLAKRIADLEGFASCNDLAGGVSMPGDPTTGSGFEYTPDNKVTVELHRALEPTASGATPDLYVQLVDAKCVSGGKRGLGRLSHR